jgi:ABC-type ATPase involved in cell division
MYFMNMETDLESRRQVMRYNLDETNARKEGDSSRQIDNLPIIISKDFRYEYDQWRNGSASSDIAREGLTPFLPFELRVDGDRDIEIKQGSLVSITGAHGSGKSTLLRILSGTYFANHGHVFSPAHLYTVHVSTEIVILDRSLWENLTFGRPGARPQRVQAILQRMQHAGSDISKQLEAELSSPEGRLLGNMGSSWLRSLPNGDKAVIHLARAFIANPEVLVLSRPRQLFSQRSASEIVGTMRDHIIERGLESPESRDTRRPRTIIYTGYRGLSVEEADMRLHIATVKHPEGHVGYITHVVDHVRPHGSESSDVEHAKSNAISLSRSLQTDAD